MGERNDRIQTVAEFRRKQTIDRFEVVAFALDAGKPIGLTRKIGSSIVEVSGTINAAIADGGALQLAGDSWDVTAWLTKDGSKDVVGIRKHERVTVRCDRIGTLVAASGRHAGVVELRDCQSVKPGT